MAPTSSAYVFTPGGSEGFHRTEGQWVRDIILGANDGLVSIMALVAGVAGATTGKAVLIAGLAGLVAGAISMALGAVVASRSYAAFYMHEKSRERWEMENLPDVEREEIRKIYAHKGFEGSQLEGVTDRITSQPDVWLEVMMNEELGLAEPPGHPSKAGAIMGGAFIVGGIFPVVPFIFSSGNAALASSILLTTAALVAAGSIRSKFTGEQPLRAAAELVAMASAGVGVSYLIGKLVGRVV